MPIQPGVVGDDNGAVTADADIEFEGSHADGQGPRKSRQGIFGCESTRAPVSLGVKASVCGR